jgi:hypothetical protein
MTYVYYIDGKKFTTDDHAEIPIDEISSPDENTPAYEEINGFKVWCEKYYRWHRLTGPAFIPRNEKEEFWLNNREYDNVHAWLKDHPNPDLYFHKIGIFTETDKILWFLQN